MADYMLGLYEKSMPNWISLREKLEAAKRGGYDFLELSIDESDEKLSRLQWTVSERFQILHDAADTGVPVRSICLSGHRRYPLGHPDAEARKKSLEIMENAIRLAADLGVRIIQLAGYDVYYEPGTQQTRLNFEQNLRISVELAAKEGVILAFETMETEFLNTVNKAMDWVKLIDSPFLQIYPDTGNITNAAISEGTNAQEDLKTGQGHLIALHLKESAPGIFREVPYGEGHVDFLTLVRQAKKMGIKRYTAEFWYNGNNSWQQELNRNNMFLRRFLDAESPDI